MRLLLVGGSRGLVTKTTFGQLGVEESLVRCMRDAFPMIREPTEIQRLGIPELLRDQRKQDRAMTTLLASETGSGKTMAYLLPLVQKLKKLEMQEGRIAAHGYPRGLVLVPTRELGVQILVVVKALCRKSRTEHAAQTESAGWDFRLTSHAVLGGKQQSQQKKWLGTHGVDVLVATPGRLMEMLQENRVSLNALRTLVVDEVDTMITGRGFSLENVRLWERFRGCRRMLDTVYVGATVRDHVARKLQTMHSQMKIIRSRDLHRVSRDRVRADFIRAKGEQGKMAELRFLLEETFHRRSKTMVFVNRSSTCALLAKQLPGLLPIGGDEAIVYLHGGLHGEERVNSWERFRSETHTQVHVVIATDVAARGLDDPDVDRVILFDFPSTEDDYLHRVGRLRHRGTVFALISAKDEDLAKRIFLKHVHGLPFDQREPLPEFQLSSKSGSWRISRNRLNLS